MTLIDRRFANLIDGVLTSGAEEARVIIDPARGTVLARAPLSTPEDAARTIAGARRAFDEGPWPRISRLERATALRAIAERLEKRAAEFARVECLNVGKPLAQARDDISGAIEALRYYAALITDWPDQVVENTADQLTLVLREPVGVVAAIVPWNYPLAIAVLAATPALAAGCTVVLKPSELTPLTALMFGELTADVLPRGVLSVLNGDGASVGAALAIDPHVDQVLFTGGTVTGARIAASAGRGIKRVALELGGKSATIVLADAPIGLAAEAALKRIALNQGENCGAGSRLLVHKSIYDDVLGQLLERARGLRIGDPLLEDTDLGPMISAQHRDRVRNHMLVATHEGRLLMEGELPLDSSLQRGFFVPISVFEVEPSHRLWREEVFGPTLAVLPFSSDDEAIRLANDSDYGLAAAIWAGDRGRALAMARQLRVGVIRINRSVPPLMAPWGGFKASGIGRGQGRFALERSTELKAISVDLS